MKGKFKADFEWDIVHFATDKISSKEKISAALVANSKKYLPTPKGNVAFLIVKKELISEGQHPVLSFYIPKQRTAFISTFAINPSPDTADWKKIRAQRIYKLAERILANSVEFKNTEKCALKYSETAQELDKVPTAFCDEDLKSLREIGTLKSENESTACELDTFVPPPPTTLAPTSTTLPLAAVFPPTFPPTTTANSPTTSVAAQPSTTSSTTTTTTITAKTTSTSTSIVAKPSVSTSTTAPVPTTVAAKSTPPTLPQKKSGPAPTVEKPPLLNKTAGTLSTAPTTSGSTTTIQK
jgi:hypothetical protein